MKISIIIPTLNEERNVKHIRTDLKNMEHKEIIIVDGGSTDNTLKYLRQEKFTIYTSEASRGKQLLKGAKESKGEWLLFVHADTRLNCNCLKEISSFISIKENKLNIGFFRLNYNSVRISSKIISFWTNLRSIVFRLPFGDQCLLIKKDNYFRLKGHSEIPIMEDIKFILKIPYFKRKLLNNSVTSSYKKFCDNGVFLQCLKHGLCQVLFFLGVDSDFINKIYKKKW